MAGGEQKEPMPNAPEAGGAVGIGILQGLKEGQAPPLPKGAPAANMADRHVLDNLNFYKAVKGGAESGNSYLTNPISQSELNALYREAFARGPSQGPVTLQNGQTWFIEKATGKFFPMQGPGSSN
jgi:hypothetical protein